MSSQIFDKLRRKKEITMPFAPFAGKTIFATVFSGTAFPGVVAGGAALFALPLAVVVAPVAVIALVIANNSNKDAKSKK